ncbi:MAG: crotonase/enoyl-CoA hydratase family protein [Alphaproteobacteria bacterium]|nr:crotonase/enoyl-CoA hydratase family protein [Alphaproteobacteria bacterium]MCY4498747.1 crotonase/enoyl-CoA hydratase family protein [Rhodospirillaceae bacterium]
MAKSTRSRKAGSRKTAPKEGRITTEEKGNVFLIGLDRPSKLNGFTTQMLDQLAEAYTEFENRDRYRCAVLFAHGDHFTAGLDLPQVAHRFSEGHGLFPPGFVDPVDIRPPRRTKPVVTAVRGYCFTLGIELMLANDIVIAGGETVFCQLEVGRGIMPSCGASMRMVERGGWGNAMRYLLTSDRFDAQEAYRMNFATEVVETGKDVSRALEIARTIAKQAPLAVRATRATSLTWLEHGHAAAAAVLDPEQLRLARTWDAGEGVQSFVERRQPRFRGR